MDQKLFFRTFSRFTQKMASGKVFDSRWQGLKFWQLVAFENIDGAGGCRVIRTAVHEDVSSLCRSAISTEELLRGHYFEVYAIDFNSPTQTNIHYGLQCQDTVGCFIALRWRQIAGNGNFGRNRRASGRRKETYLGNKKRSSFLKANKMVSRDYKTVRYYVIKKNSDAIEANDLHDVFLGTAQHLPLREQRAHTPFKGSTCGNFRD